MPTNSRRLRKSFACRSLRWRRSTARLKAARTNGPGSQDLKESGDIEQAADVVMFVYRDAYYNPETAHPDGAEVIIAKHRNGPVGQGHAAFRAVNHEV